MKYKQKKKKNPPVCALWWQDAAYSYREKLPSELPSIQLTTGFILVATDDYINISSNVDYDEKNGAIWPVDGIVIPAGVKKKFKRIKPLLDE